MSFQPLRITRTDCTAEAVVFSMFGEQAFGVIDRQFLITDVAVEKALFCRKPSKFVVCKMSRDPRRSLITNPDAILFSRI